MSIEQLLKENFSNLQNNSYPGRGIVVGQTPDGENMVQVYWIMGRSNNSRNRVFVEEPNTEMRTKAFDESQLEDPSLIIYYPARVVGEQHVITNGDQTDTVRDYLVKGSSFEEALRTREYEPDGPNFTPRISAVTEKQSYKLSILKSFFNTEAQCLRYVWEFEKAQAGIGHFISTYQEDATPLPSFSGEPQLMPLMNDIDTTLNTYWEALNKDNRVSLMVKFINTKTGIAELKIVNRHA